MVAEQDTVEEVQAQTDFEDSDPETEALDPRYRDAESHLSERMSNNHRLNKYNAENSDNLDSADKSDHLEIANDNVQKSNYRDSTENPQVEDNVEKPSVSESKWRDGLRRDESDNV